jgi:hypothetical protein
MPKLEDKYKTEEEWKTGVSEPWRSRKEIEKLESPVVRVLQYDGLMSGYNNEYYFSMISEVYEKEAATGSHYTDAIRIYAMALRSPECDEKIIDYNCQNHPVGWCSELTVDEAYTGRTKEEVADAIT